MKRMKKEEAEEYIRQVKRRGVARSLPAEQIESHKAAYTALTSYLKSNYRLYILYCLMDGKHLSKRALMKAIKQSKVSGLLYKLNKALDSGDVEEFQWCCWLLKTVYCIFRHEEEIMLKQKEPIDL